MRPIWILILSILLLAAPLLAQDEDTAAIEEKKRKLLQDEKQEKGFPELLQPEINIEPGMNIEWGINIKFPQIENPKEINNQKFLLPLLRDENPWIRAEAAKALGEIGSQAAAPSLSKCLKRDKNPYVRYRAAWALGEIGGEESLSALKKALKKEEDLQVKGMIEKSIKKIESGHFISPEVEYQNFLRVVSKIL